MKLISTFAATLFLIQIYAQENRLQPDSIYKNRKVRKIYAYLNSDKDLSEIIEFNRDGYKVRSTGYTASYNSKTRKHKWIDIITTFKYDSQMRLTLVIDSSNQFANYKYDSTGHLIRSYAEDSSSIEYDDYYYDSIGNLIRIQYFKGNFKTPFRETSYYLNPLKSTDIWYRDSLIIRNITTEYEKDLYVTKSLGYSLEPKLKHETVINNGKREAYGYVDYSEMIRYEDTTVIQNTYNSNGQLIKSALKQVFMNDRLFERNLTYKYYPNGLLQSIRGYVPEYFRYEFYE